MPHQSTSDANDEGTPQLSLPMYCFPEMEAANSAFLAELRHQLRTKGIKTAEADVPDKCSESGGTTLFTQICGYPLFKHYRDRYRLLATPHYAVPGCVGSNHRAFFMVRADDPADRLDNLRGRIFGCNSLLSNSGMNLPRLSLARIAGGAPFFSSVVVTGAHVTSLELLDQESIDVCSIDNVTWGLFKKFRPSAAERYRILDETVSSPSLPFVTSISTTESDAAAVTMTLYEIVNDSQNAHIRGVLELTGLSVPDVAAYERLADHEREATELGFSEIK
jgi:ABC-type phosphate/phosphonate transport system substrate-binding protein